MTNPTPTPSTSKHNSNPYPNSHPLFSSLDPDYQPGEISPNTSSSPTSPNDEPSSLPTNPPTSPSTSPPSPATRTHPMNLLPNPQKIVYDPFVNLSTTTSSSTIDEPTLFTVSNKHSKCCREMQEEFSTLMQNDTWTIFPYS